MDSSYSFVNRDSGWLRWRVSNEKDCGSSTARRGRADDARCLRSEIYLSLPGSAAGGTNRLAHTAMSISLEDPSQPGHHHTVPARQGDRTPPALAYSGVVYDVAMTMTLRPY